MVLMIMDLMMNSLLQRLHILPRTLETFSGIIIEGQKVETMLNLRTSRKMNQQKSIMLKNKNKKANQSSRNSLGQQCFGC